jgi:hypothetical protein
MRVATERNSLVRASGILATASSANPTADPAVVADGTFSLDLMSLRV